MNVGRENGNPTIPMVITHLSKDNSWMVKRLKHGHNLFQKILCFKYVCRAQVGRNKPKKGLSKKEFSKVLENNRERDLYEPKTPKVKIPKQDSISVTRDTISVSSESIVKPVSVLSTPKADSLITLNEFLFETNSYELNRDHVKELDVLSAYVLARPTLELTITGHTDNTGEESKNVALSAKRAERVAKYLEANGIDALKIVSRGLGSNHPIASNETADGRSRNRRVEILIRTPKR